MLLLQCRDLQKSFTYTEVLCQVDLDLHVGERVGLVGANGAGKSTLANLIFGELEPDQGSLMQFHSDLKIGYLRQSKEYQVNERGIDGYNLSVEGDFYRNTSCLGLDRVQDWDEGRMEGLSGGERTKLALARVWTHSPDLLILDEPTNHLDFTGVQWLVQELEEFRGTVLIISHDRYFLDQVVHRIVEIDAGIVQNYAGNYSFYRQEKERRYFEQLHQYQVQQKKEAKIEAEMQRVREWSAKAHREAGKVGKMAEMRMGIQEFYRGKAKKMDNGIKSRMKRLDRMREEGVDRPKEEPNVHFLLDDASKHGRRILEAQGVSKGFGERKLFQDSSFCVLRGEKVALLGDNGCGKTTLIRMILGDEVVEHGQIWISPTAKIGYLSQDVSNLNLEETVLEMLGVAGQRFIDTERKILAGLGFDEAMIERRLGELSMGERIRAKLAKLILDQADLLILDEPTNHLDLFSREELETALASYLGTMMIVSHDRYMVEKLADRLLVFADGQVCKYEGTLVEYEARRKVQVNQGQEQAKERLMVVENRLTVVLSELGRYSMDDPEYGELDQEFQKLVGEKRRLKELTKPKE